MRIATMWTAVRPTLIRAPWTHAGRPGTAQQRDELVRQDLYALFTYPTWIAYALKRAPGATGSLRHSKAAKEALRQGQRSLARQRERLMAASLQGRNPFAEYQQHRQDLEQ